MKTYGVLLFRILLSFFHRQRSKLSHGRNRRQGSVKAFYTIITACQKIKNPFTLILPPRNNRGPVYDADSHKPVTCTHDSLSGVSSIKQSAILLDAAFLSCHATRLSGLKGEVILLSSRTHNNNLIRSTLYKRHAAFP
jgi:hypothetical protein